MNLPSSLVLFIGIRAQWALFFFIFFFCCLFTVFICLYVSFLATTSWRIKIYILRNFKKCRQLLMTLLLDDLKSFVRNRVTIKSNGFKSALGKKLISFLFLNFFCVIVTVFFNAVLINRLSD